MLKVSPASRGDVKVYRETFTADEVYLLEIRKYGPETRLRHTTVHLQLALAWWEVMADWVPEGEVAGAARPRMEAGAAFGDRSSAQV